MADTPDIVIGAHPEHGVVANNHTRHPSAAFLLRRLGFERLDSGLYRMAAGSQDPTIRAAQAVAILRAAEFQVKADQAFEPAPGTLRPLQSEPSANRSLTAGAKRAPDVAFGRLDSQGVVAAVTGENPVAESILRVSGFRRDPDRADELLRLPEGMDHEQASELVHMVAKLLRATGSNVHVVPGTTTAPTPPRATAPTARRERDTEHERDSVEETDDRGLIAALRRLLQTLSERARSLGTKAGVWAANDLDATADQLGRAGVMLRDASDRLRTRFGEGPTPDVQNAAEIAAVEGLTAALDKDSSAAAVVRTLDAVTADDGPLAQVRATLGEAATACASLPGEQGPLMAAQLTEAARRLGQAADAITHVGDHLADPPPPRRGATTARMTAARAGTTARVGPRKGSPTVAHPAWAQRPAPGRTR